MSAQQKLSIGFRKPADIADYLHEIGDHEAAERFERVGASGQSLGSFFGDDAWANTGILLGYIPPVSTGAAIDILDASALEPDQSLRDTRVKIALERFWVHSYPGLGTHTILCEFTGKNQIPGTAEEMRFALTTQANDGSAASVNGAPIFLGVSVGQNGIAFEGRTVNVRSGDDETMLAALSSGPFKNGLALLTTAQPALKPLVGLTTSLVSSVLARSRNRQVYYFQLGLDFAESATSACLRHGSYVIVQGSDSGWDWADFVYKPSSHEVVRRSDGSRIGFNYMIVRVSPFVHGSGSTSSDD
jgi:hypothetical protein